MTREEFIDLIEKKNYPYSIEGDTIVFSNRINNISFDITSIPSNVVFCNQGSVNLQYLTSLSPGVVFNNGGSVHLQSLISLPLGVEFYNRGNIFLDSLTSIPVGMDFDNDGSVYLFSLSWSDVIDKWEVFNGWGGNIEGIGDKKLLNFMISKGLLER